MKRILIPTDFSTNSWKAIEYALHLFKNIKCTIYFLNTYTPAISGGRIIHHNQSRPGRQETPRERSSKQLQSLLRTIETTYPNHKHEFITVSSFSFLLDEVHELVSNHKMDCMVLGATGLSNQARCLWGSNTINLLRKGQRCAVLVVPNYPEFNVPTEIFQITNLTGNPALTDLNLIKRVRKELKLGLHIYVSGRHQEGLDQVQRYHLQIVKQRWDVKPDTIEIPLKRSTTGDSLEFQPNTRHGQLWLLSCQEIELLLKTPQAELFSWSRSVALCPVWIAPLVTTNAVVDEQASPSIANSC